MPEATIKVTTADMRRFRDAVRQAASADTDDARELAARALDRAATPITDALYDPLFRYCRTIMAGKALLRGRVEAEDLAQEAWTKFLRYLATPNADRISSGDHFRNFLFKTAHSVMRDHLDAVTRAEAVTMGTVPLDALDWTPGDTADFETRGDQMAAHPDSRVDRLLLLGDDYRVDRIERLFNDEKTFRDVRRCRAYLLLQLGLYLAEELASTTIGSVPDALESRLVDAYAEAIGVPSDWWTVVSVAAIDAAGEVNSGRIPDALSVLLPLVNRTCGVTMKPGNDLAKLRNKLKTYVTGKNTI